jgi:uncharacterized membrane protein
MSNGKQRQIANGLGWFSIGLGAGELLAPRFMAGLIGIKDQASTRATLRTYGVREIGAGIGILTNSQPAGWLWGRVAGDILDLASLAAAMRTDSNSRGRLIAATAAVAGVTALDVYCGAGLSTNGGAGGPVQLKRSIIINRAQDEVYNFWRKLENLPRFMRHLTSVQNTGATTSHWKANLPAGISLEWDAEITADEAGRQIAWRSFEGATFRNSGSVRFERATGGRGTVVRAEMQWTLPGGAAGAALAKMFGRAPGDLLGQDLHDLKQVLEIGEILRSDASVYPGMHAAAPPVEVPGEAPSLVHA